MKAEEVEQGVSERPRAGQNDVLQAARAEIEQLRASLTALSAEKATGEPCLKCHRFKSDIVHDVQGHQGTGCWVVHPFVGVAEKYLLQLAVREASMVQKSGQKGRRLSEVEAQWNVAIDAAKQQIEQMWLPVTATGQPIQPELDKFDRYFKDEYAARAKNL